MDKSTLRVQLIAVAIIAAIAVFAGFREQRYQHMVREMQEQVQAREQTIEVQKQVYSKLVVELSDLRRTVDVTTEEGKYLAEEIKKSKDQLFSMTTTLVELKDQIAKGKGTQTEPTPGRTQVGFGYDFGFVRVDGYTLSNPPEFDLRLKQGGKPLKLTLTLNQREDGTWRTLVASSDERVAVQVGISAVNPRIVLPKWYEKLKLNVDLGAGSQGVIGGLGFTYQADNLDFGPKVWGTTAGDGAAFYGATLSWAPLAKR